MTAKDTIELFAESFDPFVFERPIWVQDGLVAGTDEAGRGCLAGPVVAAAVILPSNCQIEGVTDSKKVPAKKRQELVKIIKEKALAYAIGTCSPTEIDQLNILWASMEAMKRALLELSIVPDLVLVDGPTSIPHLALRSRSIIKGDSRSHSIAAASILAKTHRDQVMLELHKHHPEYSWCTNVGYPTKQHYEAIKRHGITSHHRLSFRLN